MPIFVRFSKKMQPATVKQAFQINPPLEYRAYVGREHQQSDFDLLYVALRGVSESQPATSPGREFGFFRKKFLHIPAGVATD